MRYNARISFYVENDNVQYELVAIRITKKEKRNIIVFDTVAFVYRYAK